MHTTRGAEHWAKRVLTPKMRWNGINLRSHGRADLSRHDLHMLTSVHHRFICLKVVWRSPKAQMPRRGLLLRQSTGLFRSHTSCWWIVEYVSRTRLILHAHPYTLHGAFVSAVRSSLSATHPLKLLIHFGGPRFPPALLGSTDISLHSLFTLDR